VGRAAEDPVVAVSGADALSLMQAEPGQAAARTQATLPKTYIPYNITQDPKITHHGNLPKSWHPLVPAAPTPLVQLDDIRVVVAYARY
jgi:hypothetical protein